MLSRFKKFFKKPKDDSSHDEVEVEIGVGEETEGLPLSHATIGNQFFKPGQGNVQMSVVRKNTARNADELPDTQGRFYSPVFFSTPVGRIELNNDLPISVPEKKEKKEISENSHNLFLSESSSTSIVPIEKI